MTKFHVISAISHGERLQPPKTQRSLIMDFSKKGALYFGQVHPNVYFTFNLILQVHMELIIFSSAKDAYFDLSFDAKRIPC
jgi:hypothetical protein